MASAKFLEEALSTDVDESAVNAIVGTLETSLVTSTPAGSNTSPSPTPTVQQNHVSSSVIGSRAAPVTKHTVSNGDSLNIVLNQESGKTENAVIPGNFINQVNNCLVQTKDIKLIYPNSQSVNNRVCYVNQSVLPNGIALTSNDTSKGVQTITQAKSDSKPTGTALVIKSSVPSQTSTMTLTSNTNSLVTSTTGVVTLAKPQQIVGGTPQIVPTNVQIVNVNAIRANTPAGTQKAATIPPRVMIRAPVGGTVQPGQITLQALQGLAGGAQGHLLLKTENGQYQLLRVGGAPPTASAGQQTPVSVSGITTNNTFRVQTITNVSTPSAAVQTPVPALTTTTPVATPILGWNVARTVLIAPKPSNKSLPQKSDSCSQKIVQGQQTEHYPDHHDYYYKPGLNNYNHYKAAATVPARTPAVDQTKEKCRKFLANLLELSSREPKTVERNVRTLIQELVDTKVEPEQFCDRLEKLLNASPQPCLIGFLKKSLPLLRQSMVNHEMSIDGIRPPPPNVVFSTASVTPTPTPIRGQVQVAAGTQMRVITQHAALRPGQPIQHRIITPMRMTTATQVAANVNKGTLTTIRAPTVVRPPTQIVRTAAGPTITIRPNQTISKAQFTTRPVLTSNQFNAASKTSLLKQPLSKEKEKKNFSSSGFMGDDDINDVAAMGGVNLAEESQRILGSTEFVGTKIRSCKDDIFLHYGPLMNKMAKIAHKNGLSEPSGDVAALLSHATQERLKNLVEKLAVIAEHRIDLNKSDPRYEITQDVRSQLKCLEEIDKAERKRHEEQERELLLRAAKSRTKPEDPEQAKLKAKAKEMQRAEMEELRQREANVTALLAIGPRKKAKLDDSSGTTLPLSSSTSSSNLQLRPRTKRVCLRDLLILMEQEKDFSRSRLLYKSYFK